MSPSSSVFSNALPLCVGWGCMPLGTRDVLAVMQGEASCHEANCACSRQLTSLNAEHVGAVSLA